MADYTAQEAGKTITPRMIEALALETEERDDLEEGGEDIVAITLHQTMDAQVWAREFMKRVEQGCVLDEGMMLGWFANAIMCGWDHHARWRGNGDNS